MAKYYYNKNDNGTIIDYSPYQDGSYQYETDDEIVSYKSALYLYGDLNKKEYNKWLKEENQKNFFQKFIATSLGNYRLNPKGYSNAQQSIDVINNMVEKEGSLTSEIATLVIFYPTPDFTKPEECTEEWLIENQYNITPMTKEEWNNYYKEFARLYAFKKYKGD